jgi:histidine triad (HIT) family protein
MDKCIFCKIINKEISSELVFEDDDLIAFKDISPKAKVHILIVPKKHIISIAQLQDEDQQLVGKILFQAKLIAEQQGISKSGYKIVTNIGEDGGQVVPHLHFHLLGGEKIKVVV